jgi:hypothetical protein
MYKEQNALQQGYVNGLYVVMPLRGPIDQGAFPNVRDGNSSRIQHHDVKGGNLGIDNTDQKLRRRPIAR